MSVSIIISNYNYGHFIQGAIESIFNNEGNFIHEVIVVDDGSRDDSKKIIESIANNNNKVKPIFKDNEGQFSCFRKGIEHASGDIICFMDPDDLYAKNYLEKILDVYQKIKYIDFIYVGYKNIGKKDEIILKYNESCEIGMKPVLTAITGKLFGSLTSAISMRRTIAKKILSYPKYLDWEWMTGGDIPIEMGALIGGAYTYYLAEPLMFRQIHNQNDSIKIANDSIIQRKNKNNRKKTRHVFTKAFHIETENITSLKQEFKRLPKKNKYIYHDYLDAVKQMNISLQRKILAAFNLWRHRK